MSPFHFAVIADTHVRTEPVDLEAGYPSDALHNARNRAVAGLLRERGPAFVVHLGDVTHSLPGRPAFDATHTLARQIYRDLPVHVAPGNHDVGDKPEAQVGAPGATPASHAAFARHWGPPWRSFDHQGCHFVLLDAPLLGSGLPLEDTQRQWLQQDLRGQSRIFIFLHYPPFIVHEDEPSHYDNLAPPARKWLLDLAREHEVEAIFAGHTHTCGLNLVDGTLLYVAPSVAFTRPGFSALWPGPVAPEHGRDDTGRLGFLVVQVDEHGHHVERVRLEHPTRPSRPCPVGVWLDEPWAQQVELAVGDLDPLTRKRARDDQAVCALLEHGVRTVRIPLADLADPRLEPRARLLHALGIRLVVYSAGAPGEAERAAVARHAEQILLWEVVAPSPERVHEVAAVLQPGPVSVALSTLRTRETGGGYFSHFPAQGFDATGPLPDPLPVGLSHVSFRVTEPAAIAAAVATARRGGRVALCHVELPRGTEQTAFTDDSATAAFVRATVQAARAHPEAVILLDTWRDKDRGYWPRHGLLDPRGVPRAAAWALRG